MVARVTCGTRRSTAETRPTTIMKIDVACENRNTSNVAAIRAERHDRAQRRHPKAAFARRPADSTRRRRTRRHEQRHQGRQSQHASLGDEQEVLVVENQPAAIAGDIGVERIRAAPEPRMTVRANCRALRSPGDEWQGSGPRRRYLPSCSNVASTDSGTSDATLNARTTTAPRPIRRTFGRFTFSRKATVDHDGDRQDARA